ncbi:MAG: type II toxin-antitoxin system PemK/MazF family toxin [Promicromonosporaceae bacterium]|nr:type II toxin-antitoxin system PemK/MazF family toxin [Promicromonosporaceae bacterium]
MKRGEFWTVAGAGYTGKPRPALIIQSNAFDGTGSLTMIPTTTYEIDAPAFRIPVAADRVSGLSQDCFLMLDKITTVKKHQIGAYIGRAPSATITQTNRALATFLGIAG